MSLSFEEIWGKLSSSNPEVLTFCRDYLLELSADEKNRNTRAEDKAQTVLNICGVGATILAGFANFETSEHLKSA